MKQLSFLGAFLALAFSGCVANDTSEANDTVDDFTFSNGKSDVSGAHSADTLAQATASRAQQQLYLTAPHEWSTLYAYVEVPISDKLKRTDILFTRSFGVRGGIISIVSGHNDEGPEVAAIHTLSIFDGEPLASNFPLDQLASMVAQGIDDVDSDDISIVRTIPFSPSRQWSFYSATTRDGDLRTGMLVTENGPPGVAIAHIIGVQ